MQCKSILEDVIAKFNQRVEKNVELKKELECVEKTVQLDLGCEQYNFTLSCSKVERLNEGTIPNPDIVLISDPDTVEKLFTGEMKIMKAWALRKIKVKGSIEDLMRFRKFF